MCESFSNRCLSCGNHFRKTCKSTYFSFFADLALEFYHQSASFIQPFALGFDQLLSFLGIRIEESGLDFRLFIFQGHIARHHVTIFGKGRHSRMTRSMVHDKAFDKDTRCRGQFVVVFCRRHRVGGMRHIHNFNAMQIQRSTSFSVRFHVANGLKGVDYGGCHLEVIVSVE